MKKRLISMLAIAAMAITTVGCASTNTTTDTKAAASDDAVNIATIGGMLAGSVTGFLHTKFKIPDLLAGILTQFGLYSINLRIMGKANFGLLNQTTLFSQIKAMGSNTKTYIVLGLVKGPVSEKKYRTFC